MYKYVLICYSEEKDKNLDIVNKVAVLIKKYLLDISEKYRIDYLNIDEDNKSQVQKFLNNNSSYGNYLYDIGFSIGGDGTFLRLSHLLYGKDTPIIGVNLGRRGFLAEIEPDNLELAIKEISEGKYKIESHPYLKGNIGCINNIEYQAINDILVCKNDMFRTCELSLYIDNQFIDTYICDGILVSSSFGSTAYNRALTGVVINSNCPVLSITPIGTNDVLFKSLIISDTSKITIKSKRPENVKIGFDGSQYQSKLKDGIINIEIDKYAKNRTILHLDDFKYYKNLNSKLRRIV